MKPRAQAAPRAHRQLQDGADFDWNRPRTIDRQGIEEPFGLGFLDDGVRTFRHYCVLSYGGAWTGECAGRVDGRRGSYVASKGRS